MPLQYDIDLPDHDEPIVPVSEEETPSSNGRRRRLTVSQAHVRKSISVLQIWFREYPLTPAT